MHARAARGTGIRRTAPLSDLQPLCCVCPRSTKGILLTGCPLFIHAAEGRTAYMTCEGAGAPGGSDLGSPWRLRWQPGWMPRLLRCLLPHWLLGWAPHRMTRWVHAWLPGWQPLQLPGWLPCRVPITAKVWTLPASQRKVDFKRAGVFRAGFESLGPP